MSKSLCAHTENNLYPIELIYLDIQLFLLIQTEKLQQINLLVAVGVECVAQPVADEVDAQHCQHDEDTGEKPQPPRCVHVLQRAIHHVAPACRRRLHAQP